MNFVKGYFHPTSGQDSSNRHSQHAVTNFPTTNVEMATSPGFAIGTPARSIRASSLFPEGDFRNETRQSVLDIKGDVMVNWLHQQQLEKLWAVGAPGEGVVLKKSRDNFTCSPSSLKNSPTGFFDQVVAMNVRVS